MKPCRAGLTAQLKTLALASWTRINQRSSSPSFQAPRRHGTGTCDCRNRIMGEHGGKLIAGNSPEGGACMTARFPVPHQERRSWMAKKSDIDCGRRARLAVWCPRLLSFKAMRFSTTSELPGSTRNFRTSRPDIVIADYMLPDGTALDLLPRLKEIDPNIPS